MKKKVYTPIATRLVIYVIFMVLTLFTIMAAFTYSYAKDEIIEGSINSTHIEIKDIANQIEGRLSRVEVAVHNAAWMVEGRLDKHESLYTILHSLVQNNPFIIGSSIAFEPNYFPEKGEYFILNSYRNDDEIICFEGDERKGINYCGMNWYIIPKLLKQTYWNDPSFDEGSTASAISIYSYPLYDDKGEVYAVLSAKISLTQLTEWVNELTPFESSYSFLVNQHGYYLTHPESNQILNESIFSVALEREDSHYYEIGKQMIAGKTGTVFHDDSYATYTPVPNIGWSICNICPEQVMTAKVVQFVNTILIYFIIGVLLLSIILYLLIKKQLSPLKHFAKSAKKIAVGDFNIALPRVTSNDEMLILHDSFEYMQTYLKRYIIELQETVAINQRVESELKIAHQKEDSERNLKLALEAGNVDAWSFDVKSKIFYPLGESCSLKNEPLTFDYDSSIIHPDDIGVRDAIMNDIIQRKIGHGQVVVRYRSEMDSIFRYYEMSMVAKTENDVVVTITIAQKDITEGHLHALEREYSQKRTDFAIDSAELVLMEYDAIQQQFIINRDAITGLKLGKYLSVDDFFECLNTDDYSELRFRKIISEMNEGIDRPNSIDIRLKVKSTIGYEWMYCTIGSSPFERDEDGRIIKYVGFIKDNTKLVLLNNLQVELNTQLQTALDVGNMLPFTCEIKDNKFNVITPGRKDRLFFGIVDNIFEFDQFLSLLYLTDQEEIKATFNRMLSGSVTEIRQELRFDVEHLRDKVFEIDMSVVPCEEFGVSFKFIGYLQDITEHQQLISYLKEAKEEAEKLGKLKSAFLANMSHEIRTPLNAIVGFSELLIDAEDSETKAEYLRIISLNNDLLLKLINDILDLSKIEAGFTEIKSSEFDFSQFFYGLYLSMQQRVTNPDVNLSIIDPYSKCMVDMDKNRLAQISINYITNAIKYTAKGSIEMGYESVNGGIRVYVKDTGIGIAESKHSKVFQRFEKLDNFAQGTGLGLSITKALVESMSGEIGFESEEGVGSIFWAWVPCDYVLTDEL